MVGLLRRYSKQGDLTEAAGRLERLLAAEREPVPEPELVRLHRVEWRLGQEGLAHLVLDYESGMSGTKLQSKYGLSKGSVLRVLHDAGVDVRRQPVTEELLARVIELYEAGLSIRQTAARAGVPKTTVQNMLSKSGVVMRPAVRVPRRSAARDASPDC